MNSREIINLSFIRKRRHLRDTVILLLSILIFIAAGFYIVRTFAVVATVDNLPINAPAAEGSGLVASRQYPGVFWWNRDGGQTAKPRDAVYALKLSASGSQLAVKGTDKFPFYLYADGTTTSTTYNKQWEDIAIDSSNNIWLGNIGANGRAGDPDGCGHSAQRLYKSAEPNPGSATTIPTILAQYGFTFPNPPAGCTTYNSEAMFWLDGKLYIFAKMTGSPVYRIDLPAGTTGTATLTRLGAMTGMNNISYSSVSHDKKRFMVGGHNGFKVFESSNSSLTGDAWVRDIIAQSASWSAGFNCSEGGVACNNADGTSEGGSFFADSYSVAFVSESSHVYFATPQMYGDTSTVTPDVRPTVTLTSPAAGATVSGTIPIAAQATDDRGIAKVEFAYRQSGATTWTDIGVADTTGPYGVSWNTSGLTAGSYEVRALATDTVGQTGSSGPVVVTVSSGGDTTLPNVSLTAAPATINLGQATTLTATATDNIGVLKVEFYNTLGAIINTDLTAPYTAVWTPTVLGSRTATAKAYDAAGNVRTSIAATVNVLSAPVSGNGDVNGDSRVNALDLSTVISRDGTNYAPADFNRDGTVGAADLAILLANWTW